MASKYRRCHPKKWAGVYVYETDAVFNGSPDLCFVINFRVGRRLVWEKVGRMSEGYGPEVAAEIRAERVRAVRHGEAVKTAKEIREEQAERDKGFAEIASAYFETKGAGLKGFATDLNRYRKHLEPMFGKWRVSEITPQMVEELRKSLRHRKPATLWNVLELLRRIVNFGVKTNRCPALAFQIEMPVKNNEVIEHLTPEETRHFLETARAWPARDVGNMLLLAFFTGMRRGEMFKLRDEDVAFDLKLIRLRDPKGNKTVSIGMSSLVEKLLREQMAWRDANHPGSPFVFPGKTGEQRTDCSSVDRFRREAGLPPNFRPFHGLRHHFAVSLANSGQFSMDMISEMLTHKDASFTKKKYAQFLPETLTAASNVAAKILSGS